MELRLISLGIAGSVVLFLSSASFSQEVTFVGCRAGGNGLDKIEEHVGADARQRVANTRRGDNGKGNGGESWDLYIFNEGGSIVEFRFVCVRTADEDTVGTRYLVLDGGNPIPLGPVNSLEFDPVRP